MVTNLFLIELSFNQAYCDGRLPSPTNKRHNDTPSSSPLEVSVVCPWRHFMLVFGANEFFNDHLLQTICLEFAIDGGLE